MNKFWLAGRRVGLYRAIYQKNQWIKAIIFQATPEFSAFLRLVAV